MASDEPKVVRGDVRYEFTDQEPVSRAVDHSSDEQPGRMESLGRFLKLALGTGGKPAGDLEAGKVRLAVRRNRQSTD